MFILELRTDGTAKKRIVASDGSWTESDVTVTASGCIDLVAAGPLTNGKTYNVENKGPGRVSYFPADTSPDQSDRAGHTMYASGERAFTSVKPVANGPVWFWLPDGVYGATLAITEAI